LLTQQTTNFWLKNIFGSSLDYTKIEYSWRGCKVVRLSIFSAQKNSLKFVLCRRNKGLRFNLDYLKYPITLYWKYKNGQLPLYPYEVVLAKDIEFWIEGLDEFADEIRERFKSKPQPTLVEG